MAVTKFLPFAIVLVSCVVSGQLEKPERWQSELELQHALVGSIWDSASGSFVEIDELTNRLDTASYLLLGEKHDNPDHHSLQAMVLNHLIDQGRVDQVSFEMMDSDVRERLDAIGQQELGSLEELKEYLAWDEEGWDWNFYGPLVKTAVDAGVPVAAANISGATVGLVYGQESLPEIEGVLQEAAMEQLNRDIDESHCGMLPQSQFPAMVRVQQARDAAMAASLAEGGRGNLKVLVAGNFHIRQDLGVPNYLLARNPNLQRSDILALSFMEVAADVEDPEEYLQRFDEQAAFDLIWFTPAVSNEDYCASLQQ